MVSTAARVGSINVLLQTQLGPGMAGLNAFAGAVDRTGSTVARSVAGMDRSIGGLNRSMGNMNTRGMTSLTLGALRAGTAINQLQGIALAAGVAVGGLFPAAIAAGMIRTVDGAHRLSNQLRTVTKDADDLKNTQQALYEVAQRTRSSFDGAVTIYARTARATEHLRMTQANLLRMTETVQKAFAVGGATAQEAWGGAIQLSQGIASNRFSGDEFRSVAENAPVLLQGMANSLGVTIGKLREMAHAGQLTAATVTKAILDASAEIDDAFAKTTSTIEQAWTRVGNAVTKYAMDSENAAAGSRAIVGGLNLMADNVSGLVDIVAALGAVLVATFAARRMQAVTGWVSGLKAARIETLALAQSNQLLAQAQMQAARADFLQKRLAFNAALKAGTLSSKQLERQKKALATSSFAYRNATQAATAATTQLSVAQRAASASGMTMAAAGRAVSAAWSFMGGPFGAAMLALGGIMYLQSQRAAEAEDRSSRYADAIKKAGESSTGASPGIKQVAADLFSVGAGATAAARQVSLAAAKARELSALRELFAAVEQFGIRGGWGVRHLYTELEEARKKFEAGEISAEQFLATTDKIAREAPGHLAEYIASAEKAAKESAAAAGEVAGVGEQIEKLDGKEAKVTITIGTRTIELTDGGVGAKGERLYPSDAESQRKAAMERAAEDMRQNMLLLGRSGWDDLFNFPKEKKPKKAGAPRKTADDRFDTSVQAIQDRVEALKLEREMLGATYYEQVKREEALKLEQEALKQAREEARRKGEVDWQSAQISAEKRAEIEKVTEALAREADATRRATEAFNFSKDVIKGFLGDIMQSIRDGESIWDAFANAALSALDKIAQKLIDLALDELINGFLRNLLGLGGGLFPAAPAGGGSGLLSGGTSGLWAKGGAFGSAGVIPFAKGGAFTNSIVSRPTLFPFAKGTGLMGEAGPEAIMPLKRGPDGRLGVEVMASLQNSGIPADFLAPLLAKLSATMDRLADTGGVREVYLHVMGEEGPMFRPTIRAESQSVAVKVVQGNEKRRQKRYENGAQFA